MIIKQLLLQIILILLNAFFAATEIAIISLNEKKVKALSENGDRKAAKMLKILEDPTKFLSTIQVGITLAGFLGSAFAADNFSTLLSGYLIKTFKIAPNYISIIDTASLIAITLILSYFTLVFGELVPKRLAMRHKEKLANTVCGIISILTAVLKPIIWFLTISTNGVLRLFGINSSSNEEPVSEEDIVIMLDAGVDDGSIDSQEIKYIKNVFRLDRLTAVDIMTPRNRVIALPIDASHDNIIRTIKNGYSRIPVYSENIDEIVGILHARDYLLNKTNPEFSIKNIISAPTFVPETVHLDLLFQDMQKHRRHIVVVVDEYGAMSGIVTMEDILEELVGEIWDEQDEAIENIQKLPDNSYAVIANMPVDGFFEYFSLSKPENVEAATVNGWITEKLECIPQNGFTFEYEHIQITITKADEMMTHEILVVDNNI